MANLDNASFFKLAYGLYVVMTNDGKKDNGMICNTVVQVTSSPARLAVTISKSNYTHDVVMATGKMNVCTIAETASFQLFQRYGFKSGRDADKLAGVEVLRSSNGLAVQESDCNSFFSLEVEEYNDLGTHGMFICKVVEARVFSDVPTMTYAYYHAKVKPRPSPREKAGWVCTICGYIHEGDELPPDFVCPICKHPASDFRRLQRPGGGSSPGLSPN